MRTEADVIESMRAKFGEVSDPRVAGRTLYSLDEVLVMAFVAVLCGADDWEGVTAIAESHEKWFRKFLPLETGIPSHDTFARVFSLIDPQDVTCKMVDWIKTFCESTGGKIVAIDGKALRRSGSRKNGLKILYTVGAWATESGLILGQTVVDDKSNEITAIPQLLDMLSIQRCTVTIDAAGCQKNIAAKIVEKKADYVLAAKGNQPSLEADLQREFDKGISTNFAGMKHDCTIETETSHGRTEHRATHVLELPKDFVHKIEWAKLNTLVVVIRNWQQPGTDGQMTDHWDQRMYISSHRFNSRVLRRAPRSHWGIENSLHWVLDVQFREDDHQLRDRKGAANLAFLRRLAVSLLRQDTETKVGKGAKNKRLRAAANPDYVLKLLANAKF
jgi:predicted transposase YbfD/YdcC